MMMHEARIEVMAPAGSFESLEAALAAGAGSVYFGVGNLNMRSRGAVNFSQADLGEIVRRCHARDTRVYLTANIIVYDGDIEALRELFREAAKAQVDAVIVSDLAALQMAREFGLVVHISTQANVSNLEAVRFYSQWADVVVLARELHLEQITSIAERIREEQITGPSGNRVRLEAFVHGALCVAVSGHCSMSLASYDHSANRGDCFQSCRRRYAVQDVETGHAFEIDNEFVMSPRDLCTIACLPDLLAAGIEVLKIEGRGRSADYVDQTVRCYREAVEAIEADSFDQAKIADWRERLQRVFHRGFWEGGFYLGRKTEVWSGTAGNQATIKRRQIGRVTNYYAQSGIAEVAVQSHPIQVGNTLLITGETTAPIELSLEHLRFNGEVVDAVTRGEGVTFAVPEKVRRQDKVFLLEVRD